MAIDMSAPTEAYSGFKIRWGMDEFYFAAQGNDLNHSRKADKDDGSGFGTRVKNQLPSMQEGELKIKGLYAGGRGKVSYVFNRRFGRTTPVLAWFALAGLDVGCPATIQPSSITDNSVSGKIKDCVEFDATLDARGAFDDGFILVSPKNSATLTTTGTGVADVNTSDGGATTTGGAAQMHTFAVDGGTTPSVAMKLQQSPDGTTWTDVPSGAFASVTTVGAQRITIPFGTAIAAQVRANWTTTGTPTAVQSLVVFARGIDLDA